MIKLNEWVPTETLVGWLDPNDVIYPCAHYEHIAFLKNLPEFAYAYETYLNQLENNQDIIDAHLRSLEADEHPGMHCFANMDDNARDELYTTVYEAGWLRIGFFGAFKNGKIKKSASIDIHGSEKRLEELKRDLLKIKKDFGIKIHGWYLSPSKSWRISFDYKRVKWG